MQAVHRRLLVNSEKNKRFMFNKTFDVHLIQVRDMTRTNRWITTCLEYLMKATK